MNSMPFGEQFLAPLLFIIPILLRVLSIYALILLIKALKIYIDKNS
jgi:hypothetical protein